MTALATPADLLLRYDAQTVRDLCSDDGAAVVDLDNDAKLLCALEDSSGQLEAAALVSQLYTADQLAALTGNSAALCKRIVCDLAMLLLLARRPEKLPQQSLDQARQSVEAYLDRLRKGDRIFAVEANIQAGLPSVDGPTAIDFEFMNLITSRVKNYYPSVGSRLPIGRQ